MLALAEMRAQAGVERDAAVRAALEQAAVLGREQLGAVARRSASSPSAELGAKKDVIDSRLDQVHAGDAHRAREAERDGRRRSAEHSAQRFGQVDQSLRSHAEITEHAVASRRRRCARRWRRPTARGQWGERMAEDVLRLAGFVENVNYVKQTQVEGGTGRPDFTFPLPEGPRALHGRQVPDGRVPALPRRRHRRRAPGAPRRVPARRARCVCKELAKRDYARRSRRASRSTTC